MRSTGLRLFFLAILQLSIAPVAGAERDAPGPLPLVESGRATVELGVQRFELSYSVSSVGPLVSLQPLTSRLGGRLQLGPLGQRHELTVEQKTFVFGPRSPVVTAGESITPLSQRPIVGGDGLLVPLDLLETLYAESLGYEFRWEGAAKMLVVARRPQREVPVAVDLVHLQGVTTVVLQFPFQPRYRVSETLDGVQVELIGDRFQLDSARRLPTDELVRDVRVGPQRVRLMLPAGVEAQDYVLRDPFRLVFDIYRSRARSAGTPAAPRRPIRPREGVRTIVLDPGHGGDDTGAIGPSGTEEKDLTMMLARRLRSQLLRRLPVKVVLTRTDDVELPPDDRAALANQQKADLFISLHINSVRDPNAHGAETYFSSLEATDEAAALAAAEKNQQGGDDPRTDLQLILWDLAQSHHLAESQRLASLIQEELNRELGLRNRGVKQAPFRVLLGAAMPAVLIEFGFLSNPKEEAKLLDPEYREQLVDGVVRALTRFRARNEPKSEPAEEALR